MDKNINNIGKPRIPVKKSEKAVILLVILVALAGLFILNNILKKDAEKTIKTPVSKQEITPTPLPQTQVSITSRGFLPQAITIKKGQQVAFNNTDKNPHQVASDPHPTHTNLPGFDGQEALLTNDS